MTVSGIATLGANSDTTMLNFDKYTSAITGVINFRELSNSAANASVTSLRPVYATYQDVHSPSSPHYLPDECVAGTGLDYAYRTCRYCTAGVECAIKRELTLPNTNGTILTTGNLGDVNLLASRDSIIMGGSISLEGGILFGTPTGTSYTRDPNLDDRFVPMITWFTPIDGDVGITFATAGRIPPLPFIPSMSKAAAGSPGINSTSNTSAYSGSAPIQTTPSVTTPSTPSNQSAQNAATAPPLVLVSLDVPTIRFGLPHLGGLETAMRRFLADGCPLLAVPVDDESSAGQYLATPHDRLGAVGAPPLPQLPSQREAYPDPADGLSILPPRMPIISGAKPIGTAACWAAMGAQKVVGFSSLIDWANASGFVVPANGPGQLPTINVTAVILARDAAGLPFAATVMKCAAYGLFPPNPARPDATAEVTEAMLPGGSGVLLTTGNLADITMEVTCV